MPTQESWFDDAIIQTVWNAPVVSSELFDCFNTLANWVSTADKTVHILFNIENSGAIPANAPSLAVRSGFLKNPQIGKVVVVGMNIMPQVLARVAAVVARKDITFFPTHESALEYIKENTPIAYEK